METRTTAPPKVLGARCRSCHSKEEEGKAAATHKRGEKESHQSKGHRAEQASKERRESRHHPRVFNWSLCPSPRIATTTHFAEPLLRFHWICFFLRARFARPLALRINELNTEQHFTTDVASYSTRNGHGHTVLRFHAHVLGLKKSKVRPHPRARATKNIQRPLCSTRRCPVHY